MTPSDFIIGFVIQIIDAQLQFLFLDNIFQNQIEDGEKKKSFRFHSEHLPHPLSIVCQHISQRQDLSPIISWSEDGNGFIIHDLPKFQAEILPQYFKHKKFTSFVRQLNMYGFHKQRHNSSENYFQHQTFKKGDMLTTIRRKPEKKKKSTEVQDQKQMSQDESLKKSSVSLNHDLFIKNSDNQQDFMVEDNNQEILPQNIVSLCEYVMLQNHLLREIQPHICEKVLTMKKKKREWLKDLEEEKEGEKINNNNYYYEGLEIEDLCARMKESSTKITQILGSQ